MSSPTHSGPLQVLLVDDSLSFRRFAEQALATMDDVRVVGSVWNGQKAMEFVRKTPPDLVLLDLEMPNKNGMETLRELQFYNRMHPRQHPVQVVILSNKSEEGAAAAIQAMAGGALDFIAKPHGEDLVRSQEKLVRALRRCLRDHQMSKAPIIAATGKPWFEVPRVPTSLDMLPERRTAISVILIGISTGGPKLLGELIPELTKVTQFPILIVQHMPAFFTAGLAESLASRSSSPVFEAKHGQLVQRGLVLVAPGGKQMGLETNDQGEVAIRISNDPPIHGCRPSVDFLFKSAAPIFGSRALALVLTGMGSDGTDGLRVLREAGSYAIAQDRESSVVWGMPGSAAAAGLVDAVLTPTDIVHAVARFSREAHS